MPFCQKCGASLSEEASFCPSCGNKSGDLTQSSISEGKNQLHCPKCKSNRIMPINESSVTGAVSSHHGAFSSTVVSNQHRAFWMCSDCGEKFRSIPSLEEEIRKSRNNPLVMTILTIVSLLLTIYLATSAAQNGLSSFMLGPYAIACAVATIILFISIFVMRSKLKKMKAELKYLQGNCFN